MRAGRITTALLLKLDALRKILGGIGGMHERARPVEVIHAAGVVANPRVRLFGEIGIELVERFACERAFAHDGRHAAAGWDFVHERAGQFETGALVAGVFGKQVLKEFDRAVVLVVGGAARAVAAGEFVAIQ